MSEGAITTTEEIEELKKKLALLGKTWLIRISLVYISCTNVNVFLNWLTEHYDLSTFPPVISS